MLEKKTNLASLIVTNVVNTIEDDDDDYDSHKVDVFSVTLAGTAVTSIDDVRPLRVHSSPSELSETHDN